MRKNRLGNCPFLSLIKIATSALIVLGGIKTQATQAQVIDVGLYPTAVPDSFEVRAFSNGPQFTGVITSMTMTVRWESATGGVMNGQDLSATCLGEGLSYGVVQDVQGYRYFTVDLFSIRPLGQAQCAIDSDGAVLFGFRIRELAGCGHVSLVNNAYTALNNSNYYISLDGWDVTGEILTDPISIGNCPPCEPPAITQTSADSVPYCGEGVHLAVEASGTLPDYTWYRPDSTLFSWLPVVDDQDAPPGLYTVVVSNACGADMAQVEAVVDSNLCVPVMIDSAWFIPWSYGIYSGIQFQLSSTGSCPQYTWTMPWGESLPTDWQHQLFVHNPTAGNYMLVASNFCSSDTLVLNIVPPEPCEGPVLGSASIMAGNLCQTGPATFDVPVSGPGPITTRWYNPDGQLITGTPHFTVPFAPWGTYTFVASNYCGADTITVFHGPADTTGMSTCQPPQLLALSASPVACYNDTVNIVASVVLPGPCATLEWSNVQVLSTSGDTVVARLTSDQPPMLTATNACGQVVAEAPMELIFPVTHDRNLCRMSEPVSLDSLVALYGMPYSGGQWRLAGTDHGLFYDPAVDTSGLYQYFVDTSGVYCSVVDLGLHEFPGVYAGEDSSVTVCSSDPPFSLFNLLGGQPETGGSWRFGLLAASSIFNPAVDSPGVYRYSIQTLGSGGGCYDFAFVTVAVDTASMWYADADGDGLGDPADTLLACGQPAGFVSTADDGCPGIFGTVGDPCDDGNTQTINDTLGVDCVCAGEPGSGIADRSRTDLVLHPNPGTQGFVLAGLGQGAAQVHVLDMQGRVVLGPERVRDAVLVDAAALAKGSYVVEVLYGEGLVQRLRWVKQ